MMKWICLACLACMAALPAACGATTDFRQDDSGGVKFTMKSLPFFDDEESDGSGEISRGNEYDPEDEEYTTDAVGRKVPVRTRKGADAIQSF